MASDEIFREVADRRAMLSEVHICVEGSEQELPLLMTEQIAEMGAKQGLDERRAVRLFRRLVEEKFIRVRPTKDSPYMETDSGFWGAFVEDLTDKGLREIHVLPPEQSLEGLITALTRVLEEVQADSTLKQEERNERAAKVHQAIAALAEMGKAVPPQVLGNAISHVFFGVGT